MLVHQVADSALEPVKAALVRAITDAEKTGCVPAVLEGRQERGARRLEPRTRRRRFISSQRSNVGRDLERVRRFGRRLADRLELRKLAARSNQTWHGFER